SVCPDFVGAKSQPESAARALPTLPAAAPRTSRLCLLLILQPALRIERCHAACTGAGNSLPIHVVLDIACSENARNGSHGCHALEAAAGDDVVVLHLELPLEHI